MRKLLLNISLSFLVVSMFLPLIVQNGFSEYTASLYPDHGSRNTRIYLQVRGIPGDLYLYWDDLLLGVHAANVQDAQGGGYDIYFYPSDVFSLSNETDYNYTRLGNHNVTIQVFYKYWGGIDVGDIYVTWNTTLNFEITEYIPCPEYITLNASYHELLANWTDLYGNHTQLLDEYKILLDKYNNLSADYDNLLSSFNSLSETYYQLTGDYTKLLNNYNSLSNNFNNLTISYDELAGHFDFLTANYSSLEDSYESLNNTYIGMSNTYSQIEANFADLQESYDNLNNKYNSLQTNYNALVNETAITRNIGYLFVVTTMLFIATTTYFALRKPKQKQPIT